MSYEEYIGSIISELRDHADGKEIDSYNLVKNLRNVANDIEKEEFYKNRLKKNYRLIPID